MRSRRTDDEKLPKRRPEPCVAVETAPAICWATMSPWFASESPCCQSGCAELADRRRRAAHDAPAFGVDRDESRQAAEVEQQAVGDDDRCERVTGAGRAHAETLGRCLGNEGSDLSLARRARRCAPAWRTGCRPSSSSSRSVEVLGPQPELHRRTRSRCCRAGSSAVAPSTRRRRRRRSRRSPAPSRLTDARSTSSTAARHCFLPFFASAPSLT